MEGLKQTLLALMKSSLIGFDDMLVECESILAGGLGTSWSAVLEFSEVLKPFCYVLIGICLMIELAQVAARVDHVTWEQGLKIALKMVLARVMIDIAPTFLEACYLQAAEWISEVSGASFGGASTLGSLLNAQMELLVNGVSGLWEVLGLFISVFIVIIAIKICGVMVLIAAYGRMFELLVYLAISPLPCAFFPLGNGNGDGFSRITGKFLRGFAAICLQGVMMMISIKIFGILMTTAITGVIEKTTSLPGMTGAYGIFELCVGMLLVSIVLVLSVTKSGSWAKSILDAA